MGRWVLCRWVKWVIFLNGSDGSWVRARWPVTHQLLNSSKSHVTYTVDNLWSWCHLGNYTDRLLRTNWYTKHCWRTIFSVLYKLVCYSTVCTCWWFSVNSFWWTRIIRMSYRPSCTVLCRIITSKHNNMFPERCTNFVNSIQGLQEQIDALITFEWWFYVCCMNLHIILLLCAFRHC